MSIFSRKLGRNPFKSSGSTDAAGSTEAADEPKQSMSAKAKAAASAASDKVRRLSATASQKSEGRAPLHNRFKTRPDRAGQSRLRGRQ